jgi:hypothetical protein
MSRKIIEERGYKFVENRSLPPVVRDWCIGNKILCLIAGECFGLEELKEQLRPVPIAQVLYSYRIYKGFVVVRLNRSHVNARVSKW